MVRCPSPPDTAAPCPCSPGAAEDVTLTGLLYPLDHGTLVTDRPLGVSNEFLDGQAALAAVGRGTVLALWTPQPGLPLPDHTT